MANPREDKNVPVSETQRSSRASETAERGESQRGLSRRDPFLPTTSSLWSGSPFSFMRRFSESMDRLFEDFGMGSGWARSAWPTSLSDINRGSWSPQVEVCERDNKIVICADLPGLSKDDIRVDIQDDVLTIQGERKLQHEEKKEGFYRSERSYGSFFRSVPLPEGVDPDQVKASFENGVLEVSMPAPQRQLPRGKRIEVQGAPAAGKPSDRAA